ncbi:hypothetical protein RI129_007929 [Pyrocoelia pectoralis]|uniref:Large ribosomal subunit protein mL53 n=1 Tax=Pyrocoelia pectoralis TaxID=417401 RepID=A0AAN7VHB1_9COLE
MSIYYTGSFKKSGGLLSAITKQLNQINLKPVKKIQVQFDPFHPQSHIPREFLFHITSPKVVTTNYNCLVKTNIVCDRSDPWIRFDLLEPGKSITFLANNLTVLEILQQINTHVSSLVKPEELSNVSAPLTKSEKKKTKRNNIPAFTDVFTEETFYMSVVGFVISTLVVVFILSRYITIKPVE